MANAHLKYAIALWFVTCYLCVYVHVGRHFCSSDVIITDDGVMHRMAATITSPQAASKSHEHERFMPKTLRKKYYMQRQQYKSSTNPEKIIVNVGMPRTGTRSWMATMEKIFPNTNAEYHHVATGYIDSHFNSEDLAELLLFVNQSSPANPLYRYLMHPPINGVRVMADIPSLHTVCLSCISKYWSTYNASAPQIQNTCRQSLMYIPLNTPCCSDLNTLQVGIVPGSQMKMLVTVNRSYINRTTLRSIVPRRNAVTNTSQDPRRA